MFQWICLKHAGTPWHPIKMCHGWRPRIHLLKRWQALPQASGSRGLTVSNLTPESSPLSPISGLSDPFFGEAGWNSLKFRMLTSWIFHDFPKPMEGKFIFRIHFMQCDAVPVFLCFSSLGEGWLFYSLLLREQATLPTVQTVTVLKALQALQGLVANTRNTARCIMLHYCASCRHVVFDFCLAIELNSWVFKHVDSDTADLMESLGKLQHLCCEMYCEEPGHKVGSESDMLAASDPAYPLTCSNPCIGLAFFLLSKT